MTRKARMYSDGGARGNPGPAGAGAIIYFLHENGEEGETLAALHKYLGNRTNNQAEYEGIILGLKKAVELNIESIELYMDSELAVKQLRGEYRVKNEELAQLYMQVYNLIQSFSSVKIKHVRRERNKEADALVNTAIDENLKKK